MVNIASVIGKGALLGAGVILSSLLCVNFKTNVFNLIPTKRNRNKNKYRVIKDTDRWSNPITPWYEQYRIKDVEILKKINEI